MKKIFIILWYIPLLFLINTTNARWYNNHAVSYGQRWWAECNGDWNTVWWVWDTINNKDRAVTNSSTNLNPYPSINSSSVRSSPDWIMRCLQWDWSNPSVRYSLGWWTTTSDTWTNWNVTAYLNCFDQWWSWCDSSTYQYRVESNPFSCDSSWVWTNWSSVTFAPSTGTNLVRYVCFRSKDRAQRENSVAYTSYSSVAIIKIDKAPPSISDITNSNPTNLLATDSYLYTIYIWQNGWSPIVSVSWQMENALDTWMTSFSDTSSPWQEIWNISKVDNYRTSNWWRQYTYRITQICDQVWNCRNGTQDYNHYVFSNSTKLWTTSVSSSNLLWIADWTTKNITIILQDLYWNAIIPASWISRTIDIIWDVINTMYLNQETRSWQKSVYVNKTTDTSNYLNTRLPWWITTISSETSTDWTYNYGFKFYTPTSNQDNWPVSDPNANFVINNIKFNVNGSLWAVSNQSISSSSVIAKMSPLYYTKISWEVVTDWFSEWSVQSSNIQIVKNISSVTPTNKTLYIEFGSWDTNVSNPKLDLLYWTNSSNVSSTVWEWNGSSTIFTNSFSESTYDLYTKLLLQKWAVLNDIQNSYLATHIWYSIWWVTPIYNSDIYWKDWYWGSVWTWNTYESVLKVVWESYTKNFNEILSWQSWSEVKLIDWSITKSDLKTDVRKNVSNLIRLASTNNLWNTVNNFDFTNNTDWTKLLSWTLLYFWNEWWSNVTIVWWTVSGNKSIIVVGWNIYITWNINTSWTNSILWLVALKDSNWNGWNIYINPSVSYIKATMYADKSIISYDWLNELWWDTPFSTLKNQLYIYGSVFTENTVWWSRADPLKCPYYVTSCDTIEESQKYDLNYLRRYYLKDTNSDWIWDTPAWWWIPYFSSTSQYYKYPLVIEYNPLVETNPPVVFK